jgi:hypothetical protein
MPTASACNCTNTNTKIHALSKNESSTSFVFQAMPKASILDDLLFVKKWQDVGPKADPDMFPRIHASPKEDPDVFPRIHATVLGRLRQQWQHRF